MPIFVLFVSAGDLFDGAISVRVSLSHFKKRFYDEYILILRERHQYEVKKANNHPILKINDIVLL